MPRPLPLLQCCLLWLVLLTSQSPSNAQSHLVERPRRPLFTVIKIQELDKSTRELAEQLEILPQLTELYDPNSNLTDDRKTLLRQKILETILESYFDAVSVQGEADREQGQLLALRQTLIDKRDNGVEINNATNFLASGTLNTIGAILGFSAKTPPFPGNLNQMLSGVVSMGMSGYSIKQDHGGKTHGQGRPTVLAELFGRPVDEHTTYPESVWRFFHSPSAREPESTRAQVLENSWIFRHELEPHGSHRESLKIDMVCGVAGERKVMTIKDLTDQIDMISDVSAVAGLMAHHLRDLLRMIDTDVVLPLKE